MKNLIIIGLIFLGAYRLQQTADASAIGVARSPAGTVFEFAGTSCPAHSLAGDGSSLLRAGIYANLFAAISTAYGTADGTHFNLPDLRGKFVRGVDGSASNDPDHGTRTACNSGGATGNNVGSCEVDQYKSHNHVINTTPHNDGGGSGFSAVGGSTPDSGAVLVSGGNETRPLNVYVLYCIWY